MGPGWRRNWPACCGWTTCACSASSEERPHANVGADFNVRWLAIHRLCGAALGRCLVSCERGSFTWAAVREYLVGCLGPGEGMAAVVPAVDEVLDRGDEVLDRGEGAAAA